MSCDFTNYLFYLNNQHEVGGVNLSTGTISINQTTMYDLTAHFQLF